MVQSLGSAWNPFLSQFTARNEKYCCSLHIFSFSLLKNLVESHILRTGIDLINYYRIGSSLFLTMGAKTMFFKPDYFLANSIWRTNALETTFGTTLAQMRKIQSVMSASSSRKRSCFTRSQCEKRLLPQGPDFARTPSVLFKIRLILRICEMLFLKRALSNQHG